MSHGGGKKKKGGMPESSAEHVNVTPLIDIVMCLIIFFMVCGQLAKDESEGNVSVPQAKLGAELEDQRDRLVINIVPPPGAILDDPGKAQGEPTLRVKGADVPYGKLTELLRAEAKGNKDIKLLVRADEKQDYQYVAPVLVSCAEAKIKSVHFATRLPDRKD